MEARTSKRPRKASEKASAAFDDENVFGSPEPVLPARDEDSADEFYASITEMNADDDISSDEEDVASVGRGRDASEVSDILSVGGDGEGPKSRRVRTGRVRGNFIMRGPLKLQSRHKPAGSELHSRSVPYHQIGKERILLWLNGGNVADVERFGYMLHELSDQVALPSRRICSRSGGTMQSDPHSKTSRQGDSKEAWSWFTEGIGQWSFQRLQRHESMPAAAPENAVVSETTSDVVTGKPLNPRRLSMSPDDCINVNELFEGTPLTEAPGQQQLRRGWLINLGQRATCLAWAVHQPGDVQFLAISAEPKKSLRVSYSSAFTPGDPEPSFIYILALKGIGSAGDTSALTVDSDHPPRKVLSLCGDWGRVTQLKWCPVFKSQLINTSGLQPDRIRLGLLALVTEDGTLRVLDVHYPSPSLSGAETKRIVHCAFEARPPNTVCACLAWLSSTLIVAGCANGYVAVWDLERHLATPTPPANAIPELYHRCHSTYICDITTCYPSHPYLVISSSMDGFCRATDVRNPEPDSIQSGRSRSPLIGLCWMDHCLSVFGADDAYLVKGMNVRMFDHSTGAIRFQCAVAAVAASPVHGSILVSCSDGTVSVATATGRLKIQRPSDWCSQTWFKHEWHRGQTMSPDDYERATTDSASQSRLSSGLSRITTGFKTDNARVISTRNMETGSNNNNKKGRRQGDDKPAETIHERSTAVTPLAWNPNPIAGGWAAAAMAHGLVLVEDLCFN